jgi:hypothetical protein
MKIEDLKLKEYKKIRDGYESACNAYLKVFCDKHGFDAGDVYWIGCDVGGIAQIGDYYVDMHTVRTDIDSGAPEEEFLEWYDYCLDAGLLEIDYPTPNFHSWIKGCPHIPKERIDEILELQRLVDSKKEELLNGI